MSTGFLKPRVNQSFNDSMSLSGSGFEKHSYEWKQENCRNYHSEALLGII